MLLVPHSTGATWEAAKRGGRPRPQLWLKKLACSSSRSWVSVETEICSGVSRKTLQVTFSIDPWRPKIRPAEKSTSRFEFV